MSYKMVYSPNKCKNLSIKKGFCKVRCYKVKKRSFFSLTFPPFSYIMKLSLDLEEGYEKRNCSWDIASHGTFERL